MKILHLIVERDGERARGARKIAANHQDDAELANGVGKAEHRGGEQRSARERENDAPHSVPATAAERGGGVEHGAIDRGKAGGQRLHGKRQAVDDRADD